MAGVCLKYLTLCIALFTITSCGGFYGVQADEIEDQSAPTPGSFSTTTAVDYTSMTVNWSAAADNISSQESLRYLVCRGTSVGNVNSVEGCQTRSIMDWTANVTTFAVTGLSLSTTYYYNVLVKDEAGNISLYESTTKATKNAFISSWKTNNAGTSGATQITLPLENGGTYDFTVEWGDGSTSSITAWNASAKTHTYSSAGTYTVKIGGTIVGWRFNALGDQAKILNISQWGPLRLGNNNGYFNGASNLTITATDLLDLTGTTTLEAMFSGCSTLATVPRINEWDVSLVTNMQSVFSAASLFNSDIGNWNTGRVTNMTEMFGNASAFNQDIGGWNTSAVLYMSGMFGGATAFNKNIGGWNTSLVIGMNNMFSYAYAFNQNIGGWNTGHVTDMSRMFFYATAFNQDISGWNTGAVITMEYMFAWASAFNQNIGGWDTDHVTVMARMFLNNTGFNGTIGGWNTVAVTDMAQMFQGATAFNQDISTWVTSAVLNMNQMFNGASLFNQDISGWNTGAVTNMGGMFASALSFNQNIGGWNTGAVTIMYRMFYGASQFNQNLGGWNVQSVSSFENFTAGTNLSQANYDQILIGWAALPALQTFRSINFGSVQYTGGGSAADLARTVLTTPPNSWGITDGGAN